MSDDDTMEVSSGNVFADLELPDAENHLLKAKFVAEIYRLTKQRKLKQVEAARLLGITQPEVSKLFHGHFRNYSVERLLGFLNAFNKDVEITIRPTQDNQPGRIIFTPATA